MANNEGVSNCSQQFLVCAFVTPDTLRQYFCNIHSPDIQPIYMTTGQQIN